MCEVQGEDPAGFTTFMKIFHRVFKSHLKFRDKAEHAQCDVCYKLRKKISKARTAEARSVATEMYTKHLLSQWMDRQHYWNLRSLSRKFFSEHLQFARQLFQSDLSSSILTVIMDGMDQAKLRVPRFGYRRITKTVDKIFRPALHLAGCWLHGFKLNLAVTDEDQKKNSETQMEILCRALSDLESTCKSMPLGLHLQQDNCYREGKNQFIVNFLLLLTVLGVYRWTSLGFLRTAHSHDDIDQCFGQIARLLMGKCIANANEMVALLNDATMCGHGPATAKSKIRGSLAESYKLDQVSCWKHWVAQTGLSCKGLRRVHYIRFCLRRDMGADILDNVTELEEYRHTEPHPDDIFMISKRWLADKNISRAVVVVPAAMAASIRTGFSTPGGIAPRRKIGDNVRKNLLKYVPKCQRSGELPLEACTYLLSWAQGTLTQEAAPSSYSILQYRWKAESRKEAHVPGSWHTPRRKKHFDLTLERDTAGGDVTASSEGSEGEIDMPLDADR